MPRIRLGALVSIEDAEIARGYRAEVLFLRPPELARDEAATPEIRAM